MLNWIKNLFKRKPWELVVFHRVNYRYTDVPKYTADGCTFTALQRGNRRKVEIDVQAAWPMNSKKHAKQCRAYYFFRQWENHRISTAELRLILDKSSK